MSSVVQTRPTATQPSSHQSKHRSQTQETPEERKVRKEREARKAYEEAKRKGKEPAKPEKPERKEKAPAKPIPTEENRLQRPTNFLCKIQFRNDLPQVPVEAKLLSIPTSWERFYQYQATTLDEGRQQDLPLDPDLGIPLDILEAPQYSCPQQRPQLDPRDAALLRSEAPAAMQGVAPRARKVTNPDSLGWLMRTQYIAPDDEAPRGVGQNEKVYKEMKQADKRLAESQTYADEASAEIAIIEATFEAARAAPKHPTRPHLTAVEILPVLPDEERWAANMVQIQYDMNPVEQVDELASLPPEDRQARADRAVMKSFSVAAAEGSEALVRFAAYIIPTDAAMAQIADGALAPDAAAAGTSAAQGAVDYQWVREYHYESKPEDPAQGMVMMFFGNEQVSYLPMSGKLLMRKQKAKGKADDPRRAGEGGQLAQIERPSKVTLRRRARTDQEEDTVAKKQRFLANPIGEAEAEAQQEPQEAPAEA